MIVLAKVPKRLGRPCRAHCNKPAVLTDGHVYLCRRHAAEWFGDEQVAPLLGRSRG